MRWAATGAARPPTPHDFLLHLRNHGPVLARRLDGITGLERAGTELRVRAPAGAWALRELERRRDSLSAQARRFFGRDFSVRLLPGTEDLEALPFPVLASKLWNHVVFWVWEAGRSGALAVRKPRYREVWLPTARSGGEAACRPLDDPEAWWIAATLPKSARPEEAVPGLLDALATLARGAASYAHLVTAFPGDRAADRLEARLYGVKEWGTPGTPAPVLQKYTGRLHYADPARPPLGVRLARALLTRT